jgi:hypothetical protein
MESLGSNLTFRDVLNLALTSRDIFDRLAGITPAMIANESTGTPTAASNPNAPRFLSPARVRRLGDWFKIHARGHCTQPFCEHNQTYKGTITPCGNPDCTKSLCDFCARLGAYNLQNENADALESRWREVCHKCSEGARKQYPREGFNGCTCDTSVFDSSVCGKCHEIRIRKYRDNVADKCPSRRKCYCGGSLSKSVVRDQWVKKCSFCRGERVEQHWRFQN